MSFLSDNCVNKHKQGSFKTQLQPWFYTFAFLPRGVALSLSVSLSLSLVCLSVSLSFPPLQFSGDYQQQAAFSALQTHEFSLCSLWFLPANQQFFPMTTSFIACLARCESKILPNIAWISSHSVWSICLLVPAALQNTQCHVFLMVL